MHVTAAVRTLLDLHNLVVSSTNNKLTIRQGPFTKDLSPGVTQANRAALISVSVALSAVIDGA